MNGFQFKLSITILHGKEVRGEARSTEFAYKEKLASASSPEVDCLQFIKTSCISRKDMHRVIRMGMACISSPETPKPHESDFVCVFAWKIGLK